MPHSATPISRKMRTLPHGARFLADAALATTILWASACASNAPPEAKAPASPVGNATASTWAFHPGAATASDPTGATGDDKAKQWNIEDPQAPTREVAIDTDEGTWMNLDVSPDGREIAFDLLGDIYVLPMEGGTARAITSGMAWDMQPRYSPNGDYLAFTSDRGGGDNIWVIPRAGGEPRQVSKENFRLLNSPAWTPDGQFIAARKHFTAQRSIGSGEIWLYHISGGPGLQLTEKPNDQQDVGEPIFSPDGKYLYFSQDVTRGPFFRYNKDPHAGIYAIKRLERESGRITTFLAGAGGAVRPTPSPDGKWIAFVRRTGLKTGLFIYDLETGTERLLYDSLDRDMQETWAIHGVYPSMAFTPDSKAIIFWAQGKIQRLTLSARGEAADVREIGFRVRDTRKIAEVVRFAVDVHPDQFSTHALRWVQVAPDGSAVVFQTLGQIYIRELPNGNPRRLTNDRDVREFFPSFSRDGRSVVYTTWNDENLGDIRVVARRGGRSRVVSQEPGHYVEPAFSPDGKSIVYRRASAGPLRSQRFAHETGLYVMPSRGGQPRQLTAAGQMPHFGASSDRVFYLDVEQSPKGSSYLLKSVAVAAAQNARAEDAQVRVHVRNPAAREYRVSPDGQWLAFREYDHAYVTPLPQTGKAVDIGQKTKAVPVKRVSKDSGAYLHWSGDSRSLHWSMGAELYSSALPQVFAFLGDTPENKNGSEGDSNAQAGAQAQSEPRRIDLSMSVAADLPRGKIALVGGRIVTMVGDQVIERGTVLIDGNRIEAVGPSSQVDVPAGARTIDASGMTIIPGLVDVHAHGPQGSDGIIPQHNWLHYATLAFGVTTVHDPSNDTATIFAAAELARAGRIVAPRIFSTGSVLYGAQARIKAEVDSFEDARQHLARLKAMGAISVKSYNQPRRDQRQQVLAAARELGMMVLPEGGSLLQHNLNMIVDGHTGIEHAVPIAAGYRDIVQLWSGSDVGYTPTMGVGYGGLWGENYWYADSDVFGHERLRRFVPPFRLDPRSRRRLLASEGDWNHVAIARFCKTLADAGVRILLGAHGQREGLAAHWELWMMVQGGMSPHEALRAGTLHGAEYLGMNRDIGSIEVGKLADLAVISGNPLSDIRASENVRYTIINGRAYDARTMTAVEGDEAPQFFWQREGGATIGVGHSESETHSCGCD